MGALVSARASARRRSGSARAVGVRNGAKDKATEVAVRLRGRIDAASLSAPNFAHALWTAWVVAANPIEVRARGARGGNRPPPLLGTRKATSFPKFGRPTWPRARASASDRAATTPSGQAHRAPNNRPR